MNALTPGQEAGLVISTINILPHRQDLLDSKAGRSTLYEYGCCPRCCLPCSILKELLDSGDDLDYLLRIAPSDYGVTQYDWWDTDQDCFDRSWPPAWWELFPCPLHDEEDKVAEAH